MQHLKSNRDVLIKYSDLIASAQHTVNLGSAREALISAFLKQNLPDYITYHTGEIFDSKNARSGQIDIVLHPITSPKLNLYGTISMFPVETVLAAIEVKSSLTTGETGSLRNALSSCALVKRLSKFGHFNSPEVKGPDPNNAPFVLFAYEGGSQAAVLKDIKSFYDEDIFKKKAFRDLPDLIVVLRHGKEEEGYFLLKNEKWYYVHDFDKLYNKSSGTNTVLLALFTFLIRLVERWAANPSASSMPIDPYSKQADPTISELFKFEPPTSS